MDRARWPYEGMAWAPFERLDQLRRRRGKVLDRLGWGPIESPWRVVFEGAVFTLRAYTGANARGPVALIIPAPIKQAYIWDLHPRVSVVQRLVRAGLGVYLMQWHSPGTTEQEFGLADYAERFIRQSLQAIQRELGPGRTLLAGHSLGGTFAAMFAALHPERVAGLALLGTPLHFGPGTDVFSPWVAGGPPAPVVSALLGKISGSFLSAVSFLASPQTFVLARWQDWLASLSAPSALDTHLRVERWTYAEMPLPRRLFEETVDWLYREDRFMRGTLQLGGGTAAPERITAPLLSVVEAESAVAPPASVLPFCDAVSSTEKQLLWYEGDTGVALQHVGILVGKTAHEQLWPVITQWACRCGGQ